MRSDFLSSTITIVLGKFPDNGRLLLARRLDKTSKNKRMEQKSHIEGEDSGRNVEVRPQVQACCHRKGAVASSFP